MNVFDKFFKKFSYKFDKGYPDMNNAQDVLLLESIINNFLSEEEEINIEPEGEEKIEVSPDKEVLNVKPEVPPGGSQIYDDTIRNAIYGSEWKDKPIPRPKGKYKYEQSTFTESITSDDVEMFKKLYPISPPKVGKEIGSEGSKGVGNGEIALYWLYRFSESAKVEEGRSGDDPDLFFDSQGVEVKAWKSHTGIHGLGRFGSDKDNLNLLSIIFGFNALATLLGDGETPRTVNPTNFDGGDLVNAMNQVTTFKRIIDSNEDLESYELFKTIRTNIDRVYSSFDFGNDTTPEGMAKKIASKIVLDKLSRKPGDGNHLVNVKSDGSMKFFYITFKQLEENSDFLSDFKVAQSAIAINFEKIWG